MKDYRVNIIGLSNKVHRFDFKLGDGFFEKYGREVVSGGQFDAVVSLDKRETFIEADFNIKGQVGLVCDRTLEPFDFPLDLNRKILFKYGEAPQEISDEIIIITRDQDTLELGQLMYEFIALAIPIKKLHPRLLAEEAAAEDEPESEGKVIYTSSTADAEEEKIDPRWEKLKKLK